MKTLEELKMAMQKNLGELEKFMQNPWVQTKYAFNKNATLAEKAIGRLCYEAEEILSPHDLARLKTALRITARRWYLYKSRFVHHPPEKDS